MLREVDVEQIENIFGEGGILSDQIDNYEVRDGQIEMAADIRRFMNNRGKNVCMAEGEVGIGKSMAYLLTLIFDNSTEFPILVSTSSKTLQGQLVEKDLEDVKEMYEKKFTDDFRFMSFMGRNNYVCLKKLEALEYSHIQETYREDYEKIKDLVDSDDFDGRRPENINNRLWKKVSAQTYECPGKSCKYYKNECYYQRLKNYARSNYNKVVVVNHSLLIADYYLRQEADQSILPNTQYLVIDEAHKLEESAVSFFEKVLSSGVFKRLGTQLKKFAEDSDFVPASNAYELYKSLPADELVNRIESLAEKYDDELIEDSVEFDIDWISKLYDIINNLQNCTVMEERGEVVHEDAKVLVRRIKDIIKRFRWITNINPRYAIWGEVKNGYKKIKMAKIDVSNILEDFWNKSLYVGGEQDRELVNRKFILTSATLAVDGKFDYLAGRLGIDKRDYMSGIYSSSFDYKNQADLIIPKGCNPKKQNADEQVFDGICKIVEKGYDKTLVLFTSYRQMNNIKDDIREKFEGEYVVLEQSNDNTKSYLLRRMQNVDKGILIAQAASFGTGVDLKGDKNLVLAKLNFDRPNDPLFKARSRLVERSGGSAFMDLSIPRVSMRTKQQVGRSIRSSTDRAYIAIFDDRLLGKKGWKKHWGDIVINSLPEGLTDTIYKTL